MARKEAGILELMTRSHASAMYRNNRFFENTVKNMGKREAKSGINLSLTANFRCPKWWPN